MGDPGFLHPDFKNQQPFHHLQSINKKLVVQFHSNDNSQNMAAAGRGMIMKNHIWPKELHYPFTAI